MRSFQLIDARSWKEAASLLKTHRGKAQVLAGGGDLLYMLKDGTQGPRLSLPQVVINLETIPQADFIRYQPGAGLQLGAMATLSELATSQVIKERYPVMAQAASQVASPQLRNMATLGGNLCQKPRCWYYRTSETVCLKKGGATCYAVEGDNRYYHAILEAGPCYMVHPSDMAVALMAAGGRVKIIGPEGERWVDLENFFVSPAQNLYRENILKEDEVVTEIEVPEAPEGTRSIFLKARLRKSWDFALASVAAVVTIRNGLCQACRLALGGVAPVPYRAAKVEQPLVGQRLEPGLVEKAIEALAKEAQPMSMNGWKVRLASNLVKRALLA